MEGVSNKKSFKCSPLRSYSVFMSRIWIIWYVSIAERPRFKKNWSSWEQLNSVSSLDLSPFPTSDLVAPASELPESGLMGKPDITFGVLLWAAPLFWKKKKNPGHITEAYVGAAWTDRKGGYISYSMTRVSRSSSIWSFKASAWKI